MSLWGAPLWELAAAAMVAVGALFCLVAAIGVLRFGDVFMRMHATTKAGTLGAGLVMGALALASEDAGSAAKAGGAVIFLLLTAPVAAHMIARAAYRSGARLSPRTWIDERSDADDD
ncbi:MAG TPA: monovalent cation/H(+) antiporter subunit G [Paracoccaceae bacterium]|nr:monovalent cation/H(+) antiporter subunit G [Paracoccaceae bacterium]